MEWNLKQGKVAMRSRTIEMVRHKANLRKALGPFLERMGIKQTKFEQENLHLLKSVAFDGHITGLATMSRNLNYNHYPNLVEEMNKIFSLIDDEIK